MAMFRHLRSISTLFRPFFFIAKWLTASKTDLKFKPCEPIEHDSFKRTFKLKPFATVFSTFKLFLTVFPIEQVSLELIIFPKRHIGHLLNLEISESVSNSGSKSEDSFPKLMKISKHNSKRFPKPSNTSKTSNAALKDPEIGD